MKREKRVPKKRLSKEEEAAHEARGGDLGVIAEAIIGHRGTPTAKELLERAVGECKERAKRALGKLKHAEAELKFHETMLKECRGSLAHAQRKLEQGRSLLADLEEGVARLQNKTGRHSPGT